VKILRYASIDKGNPTRRGKKELRRMTGMKTLTKLMDKKLDKLSTNEYGRAIGLWMELEKILNGDE
tara:strand:+ start:512 stop:709 length:198 start_codon:yes stop_codon:yes gene_type:complete